jgi:hypothetical protein
VVTWPDCLVRWVDGGRCGFMPGWDNCEPNPCPQCCPETCCFPDGSCRLVWGCSGDCALLGGLPSDTWACYPDPCLVTGGPAGTDDEGVIRTESWSRIKGKYR